MRDDLGSHYASTQKDRQEVLTGSIVTSSKTAFARPAEQLFAFVTDPRNWTKVYPGGAHIAGV